MEASVQASLLGLRMVSPLLLRKVVVNSGKTTWFPRHRKMKPFPATASKVKSHVRNWRSLKSWHVKEPCAG